MFLNLMVLIGMLIILIAVSGCKYAKIPTPAGDAIYFTALSDIQFSEGDFTKDGEKVSAHVKGWKSEQSQVLETANKSLDLANKLAK